MTAKPNYPKLVNLNDGRTALYFEPTFRVFQPETVKDSNGQPVTIQQCDELVDGRWEAFITYHATWI